MKHKTNKEASKQYSSWQLIKDLLRLIRPYRGRFWFASFARMAGDVAMLYPAFAFASIVTFLTKYRSGDSLDSLWAIFALWTAAVAVRSLSQYFSKFVGYKVAEQVAIDSTLKAFRHMFRLDMAWHERENSGNKIKRIQNAANGFNNITRMWINNIIEVIVNLIVINIVIARFDTVVLVAVLVFLVTYSILSGVMSRRAAKASHEVNVQEEQVNGLLFEAVNNIRTVKVMAMAEKLFQTLSRHSEELLQRLGVRISRYQSRNALLSFWANASKIGISILIVKGILDGHYDVGFLILFNGYFSDLRASIDELSFVSVDFVASRLSVGRMRRILDEPVTIDDERGKADFPKDWRTISFRNVSFSYGDNQVLKNVSFDIRRGEKVGIVGLSGAGKSTLFRLLLKEHEGFEGDILFDDLSIKSIRKSDYFRYVSVVLQDTEVFNFSFRENIVITNAEREADEELFRKALDVAHGFDVVRKLPDGAETLIGEKGVRLSGGERQRLGIARAVFKQPQILLLDEATSHLDVESEGKIRDSLHKFFESVTAVVIAHRLTTIKEMNTILVIDNGSITESGSFDELINRKDRFYELWQKQNL